MTTSAPGGIGKAGRRASSLLTRRGEPQAEISEETVRRCGLPWTVVRWSWRATAASGVWDVSSR